MRTRWEGEVCGTTKLYIKHSAGPATIYSIAQTIPVCPPACLG